MPGQLDPELIADVLGGDQVLTPEEAAAQLGVAVDVLEDEARAGRVPSIQLMPRGGIRRYRASDITRLAATGIPPA
jgi:predicted site-specific integrase-resolvase